MKNRLFTFLADFLLQHLIWIVPSIFLIMAFRPVILMFFIPFLITIVYSVWKKKQNEIGVGQVIALIKTPPRTTILYYVAVLLFLILTMAATYIGMTKVFAMENDGFWIALGISFGVPLALFVIVLILKDRKSPMLFVLAITLYILFDLLVALPFNFLFFYDHLAKSDRVEQNETYFQTVIDKCDSIITPKLKHFTDEYSKLTDTTVIANKDANSDRLYDHAVKRLEGRRNKGYLSEDDFNREMSKLNNKFSPYNSAKNSMGTYNNKMEQIRAAKDSADFYKGLKDKIDNCKVLQDSLSLKSRIDYKEPKVNGIRKLLSEVCNESQLLYLQSLTKSLRADKYSSISSIRGFYEWLIELLTGNIRKDMTIIMSFSVSVVIDILPLLLSFLYIVFLRND